MPHISRYCNDSSFLPGALDKYIELMEKAGQMKTLCEIIAGVRNKHVDNPKANHCL